MLIWKVETLSDKVKFIREIRLNCTPNGTITGLSISHGSIGPRGGWQGGSTTGFTLAEWQAVHELVETIRGGLTSGLYKVFPVLASPYALLTCTKCTENIDARTVLDHENTPKHKEA